MKKGFYGSIGRTGRVKRIFYGNEIITSVPELYRSLEECAAERIKVLADGLVKRATAKADAQVEERVADELGRHLRAEREAIVDFIESRVAEALKVGEMTMPDTPKLTRFQLEQMYKKHRTKGTSFRELAKEYSISDKTVATYIREIEESNTNVLSFGPLDCRDKAEQFVAERIRASGECNLADLLMS